MTSMCFICSNIASIMQRRFRGTRGAVLLLSGSGHGHPGGDSRQHCRDGSRAISSQGGVDKPEEQLIRTLRDCSRSAKGVAPAERPVRLAFPGRGCRQASRSRFGRHPRGSCPSSEPATVLTVYTEVWFCYWFSMRAKSKEVVEKGADGYG